MSSVTPKPSGLLPDRWSAIDGGVRGKNKDKMKFDGETLFTIKERWSFDHGKTWNVTIKVKTMHQLC